MSAEWLTITDENIDQYRSETHDAVMIAWATDSLDVDVLRSFPNLLSLDCSRCGLTTLAGIEVCAKLEVLLCYDNELVSLKGIDCCLNLERLMCGSNKLTSLTEIEGCTRLIKLSCWGNRIRSLQPLKNCIQLRDLSCEYNQLTRLHGLENCTQLRELACNYNLLTSLVEIRNCVHIEKLLCQDNRLTELTGIDAYTQLQQLDCHANRLVSLRAIEGCEQLQHLDCGNNRLYTLSSLVYLRNLVRINHRGNPLGIQTAQVRRFLATPTHQGSTSTVYTDRQNVHDIHVQKCVCESIKQLLTDPVPQFSIDMVLESGLDQCAIQLLFGFCEDVSVHSIHLLTYLELLGYVWARIDRSEHKDELIKILGEQITDAECKCFTGRFNRKVWRANYVGSPYLSIEEDAAASSSI